MNLHYDRRDLKVTANSTDTLLKSFNSQIHDYKVDWEDQLH